jgi:hypothetical protein
MKKKNSFVIFSLLFILAGSLGHPSEGRWFFDLESGLVTSGYNDVQIPRTGGTRFSLSHDLDVRASAFYRLRLGFRISGRQELVLLGAPLTLDAEGSPGQNLFFNGVEFPSGVPLEARYKFNSYRLTYRYKLLENPRWKIGLGLTAKIRDAAISLEGGGKKAEKTNVGFVPLIHFKAEYLLNRKIGLLVEGDAAAAKQGRAEDILMALQFLVSGSLTIKAGYRFIEGGANVEEVYNFALLHFLTAGLTLRF